MTQFDGIILGTGHNALVLAGYLCRWGLKVCLIDRAETPGGGLATVDNPVLDGFRHNTHSFFHRALTEMPWYRDLELERHGAHYIEPELNVAMLLRDGRSLQWWTDFDRTYESFSQFSKRDAESLARWVDEFRPINERILVPEARSAPVSEAARLRELQRTPLGRRLLEVSALSPLEFVEREFEHDVIRAGLLFFNGLREVDLRLKGFGHSIPSLLAGRHMAQLCVGGSNRLARALVADIEEHGGEVQLETELQAILTRNGKAIGIETADGDRISARQFVASGLNPQQTFLQLIDADAVPSNTRQQADGFQYNLLAPLFALNVALAEAPRYTAAETDPELNNALMVILGLDRFSQFHEIVTAHEAGRIPSTVMWGACPTVFDPSQAPPGKHTAFMWEKLPFAVHGDAQHWDEIAEQHGRDMLALWADYAPNMREPNVLHSFVRSPLDTTRALPNMQAGDLLVGSFDHGQIRGGRPFPEAGGYRTPIDSLYLCGGSTHPGGNITGLCGSNAARTIAKDLGLATSRNS
ncbi:MAG: NAD(P)/FAD-dependent oxidoreductase [Planctomycetota bacterium]|nr:NAD(P)/FAD-dependent oxidoreductase [Planctomycetota bacterium]